ncbi:hypothetical protein [Streptomyces echinatus]|uniref:Uncharacterized protein n=1 Tax=Streptomyces echinatus TaxID=67293 RepID=A0A7W9PUY6_9ACTN|nr:hypothetical protein [Streptomyces echinatus]MBB5928429.1 hypothetical protein [Streptomyces echinatus]
MPHETIVGPPIRRRHPADGAAMPVSWPHASGPPEAGTGEAGQRASDAPAAYEGAVVAGVPVGSPAGRAPVITLAR